MGAVESILNQAWGEEQLGRIHRQHLLHIFDQWLCSDTRKSSIGKLPILTCQACGGNSGPGIIVAASWQLVRIAAKVFDDVEDGETSLTPDLLNAATGFLFVAQLVLERLLSYGVPVPLVHEIATQLSAAMLKSSAGQHADLTARCVDSMQWNPDSWLEVALAKSGELLAWAAWAGASAAGADQDVRNCYREYGSRLGIVLQIADDYNDVWGAHGTSDLATGKMNLSVCYALSVMAEDERWHLLALMEKGQQADRRAEAGARDMLVDVGAQHYTLCAAALQRGLAQAALSKAAPTTRGSLLAQQQLVASLEALIPATTSARTEEMEAVSPNLILHDSNG